MRKRMWFGAIFGLAALCCAPGSAQLPTPASPTVGAAAGSEPAAPQTHELTKADADSWLDGLIPYALDAGDIAGGVVVVVKDGQIVTARGFGYADVAKRVPVDAAKTLFRTGSISKLFTWTAVMQLVEAGKLDLDTDVNRHLDFKIPEKFGKPITLRDLLTHTPGFEETVKHLIVTDPRARPSLEKGLKRWVPTRIYPPGETPAYSNYGCALAGYIVQRVSGERFEDYVKNHILSPIGLNRSTFEQQLPPALAATMSKGYSLGSEAPKPFERLDLGPAGALSASGTDMAQFMIAHLAQGRGLLKPETAAAMHASVNTPIPGLPAMGLGFYHEDRNGLVVIGHGGDTNWFHSDLHLYPQKGVGIFLSFNSVGKNRAAYPLRQAVFDEFTHRYLAPTGPEPRADPQARRYGDAVAGTWFMSRGSFSNWLSILPALQPLTIERNSDDTITVSALTDAAGNPKRWRAIGPWRWREVGGDELLGARVEKGRPVAMGSAQLAPIIVFLPATFAMDGTWIAPTLMASLAVILLTALSWPIVALVRRRYDVASPLAGRALQWHRVSRLGGWLLIGVIAGWVAMVMMIDIDLGALDGRLDPLMRVLQLLTLLAILATVAAIVRAWSAISNGQQGWLSKIWSLGFAVSCVFVCWVLIAFHTLNPSLNF